MPTTTFAGTNPWRYTAPARPRVPTAFDWATHRHPSVMHDDPRNAAFRAKHLVKAGLQRPQAHQDCTPVSAERKTPKPTARLMAPIRQPGAIHIDPNPAASRAKTASIKTPTTVRGGK